MFSIAALSSKIVSFEEKETSLLKRGPKISKNTSELNLLLLGIDSK